MHAALSLWPQAVAFLLNTWHGYLFALVVGFAVWGIAALFALASLYGVSWWNQRKYAAVRHQAVARPVYDIPEDSALYRDFISEVELDRTQRRH